MFIQFDTPDATLKEFADKACTCSNCKKRAIQFRISRKFFQLYWIPVFPIEKMRAFAWCIYCKKAFPENFRFGYHLANTKTPWYFYSGFMIAFVLLGIIVVEWTNQANTLEEYLKNPQIGDVYLIEHTLAKDTSYQFLRIADLDLDNDVLTFYPTKKHYIQSPSALDPDDYFFVEERKIPYQYITELFKENKILSIQRSRDIAPSFNKIKLKEKTDSTFVYTANDSNVWETLLSLKYDIYFDEVKDDVVFKPKPSQAIKDLDGKMITLKAFMYSEDESDGSIYFSAFPKNLYSCIASSTEDMIKIPPIPNLTFEDHKSCIIRGKLKLNTTDFFQVPYSLKEIDCIICEPLND